MAARISLKPETHQIWANTFETACLAKGDCRLSSSIDIDLLHTVAIADHRTCRTRIQTLSMAFRAEK